MVNRLRRMRISRANLGISLRQRDVSIPSRPLPPEIISEQIYTIDGKGLQTIAGDPIIIILNPIKTISGDSLTTFTGETLITI